jgi:ATP-binding cassette subfamily B protein
MLPSDMIIFIMYINMLITSLRRIIQFTEQFQKGLTGIQRFDEVMSAESEIYEIEKPVELQNVQGNVEFSNVYFAYDTEEEWVLEDLSFEISPGEKVAFVGPSGAGKSTIINLIPRFYDVNRGSIQIDGHDIRDLSLESLRDNIGIVQQDVYLFAGTVEDNIRYGKIDATDEEVRHAAELASATEFIDELPQGFYTDIGERGARLSGGQKQRISIARVFLKNPPILILDEATSA